MSGMAAVFAARAAEIASNRSSAEPPSSADPSSTISFCESEASARSSNLAASLLGQMPLQRSLALKRSEDKTSHTKQIILGRFSRMTIPQQRYTGQQSTRWFILTMA